MENNFLKYYNNRKADFDNMLDLVDEYLSNEVRVDMGVVSCRIDKLHEIMTKNKKSALSYEETAKLNRELQKIRDFYKSIQARDVRSYSKAFWEYTGKVNKNDFKII